MNAAKLIKIALLAVIATAVGSWAMKEFGPARVLARAADGRDHAAAAVFPDGVTVINFHGAKRCRTCIAIGNLAKNTLAEEFASEQQAGKIQWRDINYDEPGNAHFVKDYSLVSSTVLVTLWQHGKEVKWKRLDGVWEHVGDPPVFRAYVSQGVRELLGQP
jgi:hypothetical protein